MNPATSIALWIKVLMFAAIAALPFLFFTLSGTKSFVLDSADAFFEGELEGAAVHSDGSVRGGAVTERTELKNVPLAYSAVQRGGTTFIGTGTNGVVYRFDDGRVEPGLYAVGWVKRGPSGVIGTNKPDAVETVASMIAELEAGLTREPADPSPDAIPALLAGTYRIRIQAGENGSIQGPAEAKWGYTTQTVADWDHDGRLDCRKTHQGGQRSGELAPRRARDGRPPGGGRGRPGSASSVPWRSRGRWCPRCRRNGWKAPPASPSRQIRPGWPSPRRSPPRSGPGG